MRARISQKWRPSLALVVGCTLSAVLCLPAIGIVLLRWWVPVLGYTGAVLVIGIAIVLITAGIGYVLWRLLLRPIAALSDRAEAIKAGEAAALEPLAHYGTAELRDLGQVVLDMGATLQNREAGVRAFSDHVTHELKSPLTGIRGAAELLEGELSAADRGQLVRTILASAGVMQGQLQALRALAAAREPLGRGPVLLSDVVAGLTAGVVVEVRADGMVPLDRAGLQAVLVQLIQNAEAHGAGRVVVKMVGNRLVICDDGSGIAPLDRARVFDVFFTTRRADGGTGMGLAIVRAMVEAAGGEIGLLEQARGAGFLIEF